jgi:hypothetical protein
LCGGLQFLMGYWAACTLWAQQKQDITGFENGKLPDENRISPKRTENGYTVLDPVSRLYCPISVRFHFYPVDSKTVS